MTSLANSCLQEMESELERFHKQNTQLELNIAEQKQKLRATEKELHLERQRVRLCSSFCILRRCKQN